MKSEFLHKHSIAVVVFILGLWLPCAYAAETIAPPAMGEQTKGTPAQIDPADQQISNSTPSQTKSVQHGGTKVTEHRRASGQVYRLELEHSVGNKQYIDETDSDGRLESSVNDIEDTPNLPKWKLGTW